MSRYLAIVGAIALVAVIIAGLVTIGGPGTARLDRQDEKRLENLLTLENHVLCHARGHGGSLPDDLASITGCVAVPPLLDPFTDKSYSYTINDDGSFSICAVFNDLGRADSWAENSTYSNFDPESGCVISR